MARWRGASHAMELSLTTTSDGEIVKTRGVRALPRSSAEAGTLVPTPPLLEEARF